MINMEQISKRTIKHLRLIANKIIVCGYSRLRKADVISTIEQHVTNNEANYTLNV